MSSGTSKDPYKQGKVAAPWKKNLKSSDPFRSLRPRGKNYRQCNFSFIRRSDIFELIIFEIFFPYEGGALTWQDKNHGRLFGIGDESSGNRRKRA